MSLKSANPPALILEVGKSTLFMKLKDVYPECFFLIEDLDNVSPLHCLSIGGCPRNQNCMETLANRVKRVFDTFDQSELLLLYYRCKATPDSTRAGVFYKDLREPRVITFNRTGWTKMKEIGVVYEWELPAELFLGKTEQGNLQSLLKTF